MRLRRSGGFAQLAPVEVDCDPLPPIRARSMKVANLFTASLSLKSHGEEVKLGWYLSRSIFDVLRDLRLARVLNGDRLSRAWPS
jgi:hypothetical protein